MKNGQQLFSTFWKRIKYSLNGSKFEATKPEQQNIEQLIQSASAEEKTFERSAEPPLLSVVMPTYNVEEYVQAAMESILHQTVTDLELIIVDDGSNDETYTIVQRIAAKDPRVNTVSIENSGNGRARNIGIDMARGRYLAFADSDDLVPRLAYEKMIQTLADTGSDFVCGSYERLEGKKKYTTRAAKRSNPSAMKATTLQLHPAAMDNPFLWSKVFVTEFWREAVGHLPEGINYEDQLPTAKAFVRSAQFDILPDCVYTWRLRPGGSLTQNKHRIEDLEQRAQVVETLRGEYRKAGEKVYQRWLAKLLQDDYYYFAVSAYRATDAYIEFLRSEYRKVSDELKSDGWAHLSYMHSKLAQTLISSSCTRKKLEGVLSVFRTYGERPYAIGRISQDYFLSGPAEDSPIAAESLLGLPINSNDLVTDPSLIDMESGENGAVILTVHIGVKGLDPSLVNVEAVLSENEQGAVSTHKFRIVEDDRANLAVSDPYVDQSSGCIEVILSREEIEDDVLSGWNTFSVVTSAGNCEAVQSPITSAQSKVSYFGAVDRDLKRVIVGKSEGKLIWRIEQPQAVARSVRAVSETEVIVDVDHDGDDYVGVQLKAETNGQAIEWDTLVKSQTENGCSISASITSFKSKLPLTARSSISLSLLRRNGSVTRVALAASSETPWSTEILRSNLRLSTSGWGYCSVVYQRWRPVVTYAGIDNESELLRIEGYAGINEISTPMVTLTDASGAICGGGLVTRNPEDSSWYVDIDLGTFVDGDAGLHNGRYLLRWKSSWHRKASDQYYIEFGLGEDVRTTLPLFSTRFRAEITSSHTGYTVVNLGAPFSVGERGRYNQRSLQSKYFGSKRMPIVDTDVFVECFDGKSYGDNVAPVVEAIRALDPNRRIFIGVLNNVVDLPDFVIPVVRFSEEWYSAISRSGVLITNNNFPEWFIKGDSQLFVQLWHGTPLKTLLFDMYVESKHLEYWQLMERQVQYWDLLIAQNEYSREIFRSCFDYSGLIEVTGYPRNDSLFSSEFRRRAIREELGLGGDEIVVLYMPTWRESLRGADGLVRAASFADWDTILPGLSGPGARRKYRVMQRSHHVSASRRETSNSQIVDVTDYPSVSDLFLAADVLVTDYSSAMFDFAITGKPLVFMVPDYDEYSNEQRGLYFDLAGNAPGPVVRSSIELLDTLANWERLKNTADSANYAAFRERFSMRDDGRSAERVAALVLQMSGAAKERGGRLPQVWSGEETSGWS